MCQLVLAILPLDTTLQKAINVNEARGIGRMLPDPLLLVRPGHETTHYGHGHMKYNSKETEKTTWIHISISWPQTLSQQLSCRGGCMGGWEIPDSSSKLKHGHLRHNSIGLFHLIRIPRFSVSVQPSVATDTLSLYILEGWNAMICLP